MSEPVVFESLSDRVNKFNERVNKHIESQTLNPFSGSFKPGSRSPSPRPSFSKDEYGKPIAGSLTEQRGRKAHSHICREILELCEIIYDMGQYQAKYREKDDDEDEPQEEDTPVIVRFGDLFQMYTKISDKCVGLLIAAKKRKLVYFEGEILFQRRDDDVLIALMKPIEEIRAILQQEAPDLIPHNVPESEQQQQQQTNS